MTTRTVREGNGDCAWLACAVSTMASAAARVVRANLRMRFLSPATARMGGVEILPVSAVLQNAQCHHIPSGRLYVPYGCRSRKAGTQHPRGCNRPPERMDRHPPSHSAGGQRSIVLA